MRRTGWRRRARPSPAILTCPQKQTSDPSVSHSVSSVSPRLWNPTPPQRNKKTGQPLQDANGVNMALTSHTLAPVMVAVGGAGLKDSVKMRDDLPEAGIASITATFINLCGYEAPSDYCPTLIKTD